MERKHTPTPWHVANGSHIHDKPTEFDETGARIGDTPNRIAAIEYPYGDAEGKAFNAEYIVRAVNCHDELVEALKRARDHMIMSEGVFISDGKIGQSADWAEALQQVRAAVDKAEGKQP
jgi:hypothetical protein